MARNLLFLLGGSAAFDVAADEFVPAAGGRGARIALLLQGGPNWQKYVPDYARPWIARGASRYDVIVPDENGDLNLDDVATKLASATGIFIGGGYTATYRKLYATEPVRSFLRRRYDNHIPIAGCSAGALIAPEICAYHSGESDGDSPIAGGLGLISGFVVGVHFSEQEVLPNLLAAMTASGTTCAWGIEDAACVMFEDERLKLVLGRSAYEIVMTDLDKRAYRIEERIAF